MGLLSRASHLDVKPGLVFSDFIIKYSLKNCAILEKDDIYYSLKHSIGFDANTVNTISSTPAFWKGLCRVQGQIYHFEKSDGSISPLLQLFPQKIKDELKEVFVCRGFSERIFLSLNNFKSEAAQDLDYIIPGFHNCNIENLSPLIKENTTVLKFSLDFTKAIGRFMGPDHHIREIFNAKSPVYFDEFYNRLLCIYNQNDATTVKENLILNTVFITDNNFPAKLIENHLKMNFKEVMESSADLIEINFVGEAKTAGDIKEFLQAE